MDFTDRLWSMLLLLWAKLRTVQGAILLIFALFLVYGSTSGLFDLGSLNLTGTPTGAVVLAPLNGNASSSGNQSAGNQTYNISGGNGVNALLSAPADLAVTSISFSPSEPIEGDTVSITAKISNLGDASASLDDVSVTLAVDGFASASKPVNLTGRPEADVSFAWAALKGLHSISVTADPLGLISGDNRSNNQMAKSINVSSKSNAPVLQPIAPISVNGGDRAIITANASDPDKDILTYSINDSRFTQSGNIFTWRTSGYDTGSYMALVSVSDGSFTDTTSVQIIVNSVGGGGGYAPQSILLSTVDGYVYDNSESLVSGANVTGLCLNNSNTFSAVSNSLGRYSGIFDCPFNTAINVSAAKNNYTGYNSGISDGTGHAAIDITIPFSNIEIPEFPTTAIPALLSIASFGILRRRKR